MKRTNAQDIPDFLSILGRGIPELVPAAPYPNITVMFCALGLTEGKSRVWCYLQGHEEEDWQVVTADISKWSSQIHDQIEILQEEGETCKHEYTVE